MRKIILPFICLIFTGCASMHLVGAENRQSISQLSTGLTKQQVTAYMGDVHLWDMGVEITNPYSSEIIKNNGKEYEVLYYYTGVKRADFEIKEDELTPLVFENDRLIGWGWKFVKDIME